MADKDPSTATLLEQLRAGDAGAAEQLLPRVYDELRRIASGYMDQERTGHTLEPTALVHEAWSRMTAKEGASSWEDDTHFVRVAARAMRNVLVDHARRRGSVKRGVRAQLEDGVLEQLLVHYDRNRIDVLAVHEALERLRRADPEAGTVVELRFFVGLDMSQCARVLGRSVSTVERHWRVARAWLRKEIPRGRD